MPEQIVIKGAGVPGAPNSYYSEAKTLVANGADDSPPTAGYTVIPDVGFIMPIALPANVSLALRTSESPPEYVTVVAAGGPGLTWSDGSNVFAVNHDPVASPETEITYYVLAEKP